VTGRTPDLLQDCDRKLSRALSKTPEAYARPDRCDVCDAPQMVLPDGAHACGPVGVCPNCKGSGYCGNGANCELRACDGVSVVDPQTKP
jgi:hypothetical protein